MNGLENILSICEVPELQPVLLRQNFTSVCKYFWVFNSFCFSRRPHNSYSHTVFAKHHVFGKTEILCFLGRALF